MISIASTPTSFTVCFSTAVAMPQPQNDVAIKWEVEAPYLATSKDHIKAAILTDNDLWRCMGSSRYQICFHMKVAETGDRLCFASLNFEANTAALRICDTEKVQLPSIENAKNLGFVDCLLRSSTTAYRLFESDTESTTSGKSTLPRLSNLHHYTSWRWTIPRTPHQNTLGPQCFLVATSYESQCEIFWPLEPFLDWASLIR